MIDNKVVGQAIAALRQAENMTQQTLAACLNVSHQAVSKWENGAALPDVLTLLEISRMFGVTLEQLLAGDIEGRLGRDASAEGEKPRVIELKLDGNGLSDRVNDALKGAQEAADEAAQGAADDGAAEAQAESAEEPFDIEKVIAMAPFMSRAALEELIAKHPGAFSPRQLSRLAPFVSADFLAKLIAGSEAEINWDSLRRLAPFLKKEAVDALTMAVAKGEKYARPAAKTIQKSADEFGKTITKGINKALQFAREVGAQITSDAVKVNGPKAPQAPKAPKAPEAPKAPAGRASEARRRIFERALSEGKFDWIAEHMDQLEDAELKARIAARARELGMNDWIQEHLGDLCDQASLDDALLSGNWDYIAEHLEGLDAETLEMIATTAANEGRWDWLGEHLDEMELPEEYLMTVATAATDAGKWDWLGEHIDEMELPGEFLMTIATAATGAGQWDWLGEHIDEMELPEEFADQIVSAAIGAGQWDWLGEHIDELEIGERAGELTLAAYRAGARDFALEVLDEHADEIELSELIGEMIAKNDAEFIGQVIEHVDEDQANEICLALANAGQIDLAAQFAEHCCEDTVAELIEIATEKGSWSAIEKLNEYLD